MLGWTFFFSFSLANATPGQVRLPWIKYIMMLKIK